jgi:hypothetical protein
LRFDVIAEVLLLDDSAADFNLGDVLAEKWQAGNLKAWAALVADGLESWAVSGSGRVVYPRSLNVTHDGRGQATLPNHEIFEELRSLHITLLTAESFDRIALAVFTPIKNSAT